MRVFKLRFPEAKVSHWASRYNASPADAGLMQDLRAAALDQGFLTKRQFLTICAWKTQRSKSRCATNDEFTVRTVTKAALATTDEALKMDLLRTLHGVQWPTASALLHFADERFYPILDYRALWSLGYATPPAYTSEFWLAYLDFTRQTASRLGVSIRDLDRALWQYSKERQ